ncbi:uncharacterized protein LOC114734049 isoform X1 [Neltuma alba]|uniref:uncharacterized protein LOC114734049 isoform X1 n=1 Tax=Neltuma alba TaxID=207710 RepID=UPI0010A455C1|nr:uncharacterized protein LOC114734049 isoform X1 [Prosopis alba]
MELAISSSCVAGSDIRCLFCSKKAKNLSSSSRLRYPHGISDKYLDFLTPSHAPSPKMVASATKMVSSVYRGRDSNIRFNNNKILKLDSCLVIPPAPNCGKPRAIIKFLGGAFIGAVPEVTYGYLIEYLAREGFLVILVPYNVTFDHTQAAKQVHERFQACLDTILTSGLPEANLSPAQLGDLPLFSVGHSNGALLQLLIGSYFSEKIPKANAIISYNNRPATEAVPYFEQLGPVVSQMMPAVEATPVYAMARNATVVTLDICAGDAWKTMINAVGSIVQETEREALTSLTKFVDQLPSVMNEVTQGVSEFKPTPSENRDCFKCSYNVEHTLLVKFSSDTIDETDILEETLKPRVDSLGGTLEKVQLSGNHITPCIQDPKWQVGDLYTPADAIAQGLKSLSLNETKILARTISDWFRRFES